MERGEGGREEGRGEIRGPGFVGTSAESRRQRRSDPIFRDERSAGVEHIIISDSVFKLRH